MTERTLKIYLNKEYRYNLFMHSKTKLTFNMNRIQEKKTTAQELIDWAVT